MASARHPPVREGELARLFYRKTRLLHVELPAAVQSGVDAKEVDKFRQEILDVMPPVPIPAKEDDGAAYAQGLQMAHIRLTHICGRLIRTACQVFIERARRELVRARDTAVRREDIQRYRDEILGENFSRDTSTSNEEQWQQFRSKIREAVAAAKAAKAEIMKDKDKAEKHKRLRFSDIINVDEIDDEELDEASVVIAPNPSVGDSRNELAHDFDPVSASGGYTVINSQDPPLPSMFDQESSSESFLSSSESFIPSSESFDLTSDTFNCDSTDSDADDACPTSSFPPHANDGSFSNPGIMLREEDLDEYVEEDNRNLHPCLLRPSPYFDSSPPDSPLLSSGLEAPQAIFDW
ncbi:hypothetical protein DV735_g2127, partial [Chaetothyriales sp. CBS 134920]